ncbi:YhgE/Pip domain-containing protein [Bacillus arachidis]|uniref:YhgE/Pip domain-containing protein n=1 Tax=Bacillus arachidis TaxID=2819290 RepID=UPI00255CD07E|nr:YhgE/Pip domain-containing protein [Bacillus arachidis]WIY62281.1 YhgE/Pip domain-containing protein [Bacillus arachidis]
MRGFTLLGKEFTEIIKSKKILIPIIAVLFVPLLYAGMFLWAFWDPYDQLDDLPVAVVNLDKGAVFDGKSIEVGKGLVDELKDNKSFKWEFVSEKTAKEGMENRKYYMLVRIPENFSDNATTLLKENPRRLNLEYIPNESLNFLSSQIGGTAIEKIKGEVSNTLTKTYAEKMFDSLKDVSQGFADGSDGANKLHDGAGELQDGSGKVTDGLHTLQGKSGEMKNGVDQLVGGSGKLLDGSGQVSSGLNLLNSKTGELKNGVGQLVDGSGQVSGGLNLLNSKTGELKNGVGQLVDGSNQVTDGLHLLANQSATLQKGTTDLATGMTGLANAQSELETGAKDIQDGIHTLNSKVQASISSLKDLEPKLAELGAASQKVEGLSQVSQENVKASKETMDDLVALQNAINSLPKESQDKLQPLMKSATNNMAAVQKQSAIIAGGTSELKEKVSGLQVKLPDTNQLTNLANGINPLEQGQMKFVTNFHTFGEKLDTATSGADSLSKGSEKLIQGVNKLADGSNKVTNGLVQLATKSDEMIGGIGKLADGSNKVTNGLVQLSTKSNEMIGGIGKLAEGSNKVTNGLDTLNGGLNKMLDGSGQLIDGVNKLADGSGKVTDGLVKVNDGTGELAEKLGAGAEKTGEVKGTDKTYEMFADPVKVQTEKMAEVPNYGTGFTPYFLSLGLFVGALLLSIVFPLRETVGIPKSGLSWFISKFGVLLAVGVIQALVADAVLLLGLGIEVQSVAYFVLFSILTSLSFIALIQFLVTTFSDAGRFIAILTLILQLTTSAGTFPLELIPKPLQVFNAWLPMTYSVSGFKAVVSSGDFGFMWQNVGILMIFIVLLSLGTIGSLTWMHKRQFRNLVEEKSIEA